MKATALRYILLVSPVLFALAAAVLIAHAGSGDAVNAVSTQQPAMMSIPF